MTRAPLLDHLRWLAAAAVLLSHVRNLVMVDHPQLEAPGLWADAFYAVSGCGHVAVVLFFVLSGALVGERVWSLAEAADFDTAWRRFAIDRCTRIAIVLWPALLLSAACLAIYVRLGTASPLLTDAAWCAGWQPPLPHDLDWRPWLATTLLLNGLLADTVRTDGPLWSLACEWTCYVFAAAIVLLMRKPWTRAMFAVAGYALLVAWLALRSDGAVSAAVATWLVGFAAIRIRHRCSLHSAATFGAAACLSVAGVAIGRAQVAHDPIVALAFAPLLMHERTWAMQSAARIGRALAARSYSLYAVHAPVATVLLAGAQRAGWWHERGHWNAASLAMVAALCAACVAVAWAFAAATELRTAACRDWLMRRSARSVIGRVVA